MEIKAVPTAKDPLCDDEFSRHVEFMNIVLAAILFSEKSLLEEIKRLEELLENMYLPCYE